MSSKWPLSLPILGLAVEREKTVHRRDRVKIFMADTVRVETSLPKTSFLYAIFIAHAHVGPEIEKGGSEG